MGAQCPGPVKRGQLPPTGTFAPLALAAVCVLPRPEMTGSTPKTRGGGVTWATCPLPCRSQPGLQLGVSAPLHVAGPVLCAPGISAKSRHGLHRPWPAVCASPRKTPSAEPLWKPPLLPPQEASQRSLGSESHGPAPSSKCLCGWLSVFSVLGRREGAQ